MFRQLGSTEKDRVDPRAAQVRQTQPMGGGVSGTSSRLSTPCAPGIGQAGGAKGRCSIDSVESKADMPAAHTAAQAPSAGHGASAPVALWQSSALDAIVVSAVMEYSTWEALPPHSGCAACASPAAEKTASPSASTRARHVAAAISSLDNRDRAGADENKDMRQREQRCSV